MTMPVVYDVIIVGGGPAGCSTALALNRKTRNHPFVLVDDADPAAFRIGESLPGIATRTLSYLSPSLSNRFNHNVSQGEHTQCAGNSFAWSSHHIHEQYSIMNLYGSGWHLDRALFDESLRDAVRDSCETTKDDPVPSRVTRERLISLERRDDIWWVQTEHVDTGATSLYHSKWVVDATGRKASLSRKLGAKILKADKLLAFYCVLVCSEDDTNKKNKSKLKFKSITVQYFFAKH